MIIRNFVILNYIYNRYGGCYRFRFLRGQGNEIVVKELFDPAANVSEMFRFMSPYNMASHSSDGNGLNWKDFHIACHELYTVASEAVAGFAQLCAYGVSKCKFLTELLGYHILNLQDFNCLLPIYFYHKYWCSMSCHKFPKINCATKTAHSLYDF